MPAEMLELSLHAERGPMVVDDLRQAAQLAADRRGRLDPLLGRLVRYRRPPGAVWLLPTVESSARSSTSAGSHRSPRALSPPRPGDRGVDGGTRCCHDERRRARGIDEMVAAVEEGSAPALAEGPCAETSAGRRALLRGATRRSRPRCALTTRGLGRWRCRIDPPDVHLRVRRDTCEASVELAVGDLANGPVLAPGH